MENICTKYTCDTLLVYYNDFVIFQVNRWILRPAMQAFIMLTAAGLCLASAMLVEDGVEDVGFVVMAVLAGCMSLLMAILLFHTMYTMYKIKRAVRYAARIHVEDDEQSYAKLVEASHLAQQMPMC